MTKKKNVCQVCDGTQVVKGELENKPCPALSVTALGRFACRLPDGSFEVRKESPRVSNARMQKDKAYEERNRVVAALAKAVVKLGGRAGRLTTKIEEWNPEWHGCVQIDPPGGGQQWRWHFHDSHAAIFAFLPVVDWEYDGHTTPEKYKKLEAWNP